MDEQWSGRGFGREDSLRFPPAGITLGSGSGTSGLVSTDRIVLQIYSLALTRGVTTSLKMMTLIHWRPHTLAIKSRGCLLGSGEAVTDVPPPSAWSPVCPPISPGSASVSSERPATLLCPSPPALACGPRSGPGPLTFSGRKCNA
ncbi:hypothetical protein MDA_GLEAN10007724 [Myotis davidii]|uniref:Uncharacterized protein n=1 Tax=Myotis davidii TaxID=225400 RepID=L5M4W6_MYODS|nr:hypothetical protein MDA_GLEAN10007724 [Myotis davidii]